MLNIINGRYRSLPALPMSNNCTNFTPLKNKCALCLSMTSAVPTIKVVLKIFLPNNRC